MENHPKKIFYPSNCFYVDGYFAMVQTDTVSFQTDFNSKLGCGKHDCATQVKILCYLVFPQREREMASN